MTTPKKEAPAAPTVAVAKVEAAVQVEFIPHGSNDKNKLKLHMVKTMIAVPTKSGVKPTDQDCIKFIALCQARKLNPFEGDAYMIGYDTKDGPKFNLITAHQAFLKRAELNSEYDGMESGVIVQRDGNVVDLEGDFTMDDDILLGGWAKVYCKNRSKPMVKRLKLKRFQKPFGIWQDDPAGMIVKCTEADALRSTFPTLLGGMYMREEPPEPTTTTAMTAPLFTSDKEPPAKALPQAKPLGPKDKLRVLLEESGILEADLIEFLSMRELASATDTKIDQMLDENAATAVDNWEEIAEELKEQLSR